MDCLSCQILTGAGFALQQNRDISGSGLTNLLIDRLHGLRSADEFLELDLAPPFLEQQIRAINRPFFRWRFQSVAATLRQPLGAWHTDTYLLSRADMAVRMSPRLSQKKNLRDRTIGGDDFKQFNSVNLARPERGCRHNQYIEELRLETLQHPVQTRAHGRQPRHAPRRPIPAA